MTSLGRFAGRYFDENGRIYTNILNTHTLWTQKSMWRYLFERNSNINCPIIIIFGTVVTETISYWIGVSFLHLTYFVQHHHLGNHTTWKLMMRSGYDWLKSHDLRCRRNDVNDWAHVVSAGRAFHDAWSSNREIARLPTVESLTEGTTRRLVPAERSVRRPCRYMYYYLKPADPDIEGRSHVILCTSARQLYIQSAVRHLL